MDFKELLAVDYQAKAIRKKAENGKATQLDANVYSERVAVAVSKALKSTLAEIREQRDIEWSDLSFIPTMINDAWDMVNDVEVAAQIADWKKLGLGLKPKRVQCPQERIDNYMNALYKAEREWRNEL